ncbi:MAG: zinc dependent phospholipase C family protein [Bacteroidota bacterium]|nr:zinc dependent phospholipase C family protein [Bacteroidota bacterium]
MNRFLIVVIFIFAAVGICNGWGFFAHKRINRLAVFTLPPEMLPFYKYHIAFITEKAVNPDSRRYAVEGEAPRHYIDADKYGDSAIFKLPRFWKEAVEKYTEDSLMMHGINPWFVNKIKYQLTEAFKRADANAILRLSADMGHYIADGNVPLHTTFNYNGQFTGQYGIHGFWESRLPELFAEEYDYYIGPAEYERFPQIRAWKSIIAAHTALDSVLYFEKELTKRFPEDKKYSYEERNNISVRVYSKPFSKAYHEALSGQVERRMRASIKMVGDMWYTCWVDAGQPDLNKLIEFKFSEDELKLMEEERKQWEQKLIDARPESSIKGIDSDGHHAHSGCCCEYQYVTYKPLPHIEK